MEKLVVSVLLFGLVAMAAADCDYLARLKVKSQWADAYGTGKQRTHFGEALWRGVFAHEPKAKELLKRVHSDDIKSPQFRAHSARVLGGLDMVISLLDDEAAFNSALAHLNEQHKERNIPANYFRVLGDVLMEVIPASLGRCFDAEAFQSCYDVIAHGMSD